MNTPSDAARPLTFDEVSEFIRYDPDTGEFWWKRARSQKNAGEKAGRIDNRGYYMIGLNDRMHLAHRIAWLLATGELPPPGSQIDHINLNLADNRICNLRLVTANQNQWNKGLQSNNTTGFKGVSRCKKTGKYRACIGVNRRQIRLGVFDTAEAAGDAYAKASREYHGVFGRAGETAKINHKPETKLRAALNEGEGK